MRSRLGGGGWVASAALAAPLLLMADLLASGRTPIPPAVVLSIAGSWLAWLALRSWRSRLRTRTPRRLPAAGERLD